MSFLGTCSSACDLRGRGPKVKPRPSAHNQTTWELNRDLAVAAHRPAEACRALHFAQGVADVPVAQGARSSLNAQVFAPGGPVMASFGHE